MKPLPIPAPWRRHITDWLTWLAAAARPATTIKLRRAQMARLARAYPDRCPWSITLEELTAWVGGQGWDADTLRSHRSAMRSFWAWGSATGRTTQNPAAGLPSVKAKPGVPRPAPRHRVTEALLAADERDALMIRLGQHAGLRASEIARVHTDDLIEDLMGWSLRVRGKGGKERIVPLTRRLALELRTRPRGWVFPGRIDGHLSAGYVSKRLSWALGKGVTGHQLRHAFGTTAYQRGGHDIRAVQELLGHSSPETTARYTAVSRESLRAAVQAVEELSA